MSEPTLYTAPSSLETFQQAPEPWEIASLQRLRERGFKLAPMRVVPASAEDAFYRLNALPDQLSNLFKDVDPTFPDEDAIEELAPQALQLLKRHYLLDEFIDAFYSSLEALPSVLQVRRCETEGKRAVRGRPALIALKDVWTDEWTFEAVRARLESTQSIALNAEPVIVNPADEVSASEDLHDTVREVLDENVRVWAHSELGITRLSRYLKQPLK